MIDHKFTEDDKKQIVDFLNFIANRAVFPDWKTADSITHFKFLAYMQQTLLPKIDANILEVVALRQVDESKKDEAKPEKPARAKKE